MGKFDPDSYRQYRPYYPVEMFTAFRAALKSRGAALPWQVADLGCGTGHSSLSWLRALHEASAAWDSRVIGIDPDPRMLERARELSREDAEERAVFYSGSGEETGLEASSVDAVLVGSAFHWMDAEKARDEILRILRPRGALCVFEYQFPKALLLPELNEWIRRQFNLRWKAPGQKPRGDFSEVTRVFRESDRFELLSEDRPPMVLKLTPDQLSGLLLSQSRVLHFLWAIPDEGERDRFRAELRSTVRDLMRDASADFDFKLVCATFGLK